MDHYLISFPSAWMQLTDEEFPEVVRTSHEAIEEAKAAGAYVFGGGIDESIEPVVIDGEGVRSPGRTQLDGGFCVIRAATREEAEHWAARIAKGCRTPQELRAFMYDPAS